MPHELGHGRPEDPGPPPEPKNREERMLPEGALRRLRRVEAKGVRSDFVKRDEVGNISRIDCRVCGAVIADWVVVRTQTRKIEKGPQVMEHFMAFRYLNNFRKVEMELESGALYRTNMCADCAANLSDPDVLEAIYLSDVVAWARLDANEGIDPEVHRGRQKARHEDRIKPGGRVRVIEPSAEPEA